MLLRHLIGVNFRLYMAPHLILQVSDVLIYLAVMVKNIILTIR